MLYHMVFFNPSRHKKGYDYYNSKTQSRRRSTHNQFDLDLVRKSLRDTWTLSGFGSDAIQSAVWDFEHAIGNSVTVGNPLHKYLNGHIITVNDTERALWFRLNHENVGKYGVVMTHMYVDLDQSEIQKYTDEMKQLMNDRDHEIRVNSTLNDIQRNYSRLDKMNYSFNDVITKHINEVDSLLTTYSKIIDEMNTKRDNIIMQFDNYMKSKQITL